MPVHLSSITALIMSEGLTAVCSQQLRIRHNVKVAGAVQPLSCCCGKVSHCSTFTGGHAWSQSCHQFPFTPRSRCQLPFVHIYPNVKVAAAILSL